MTIFITTRWRLPKVVLGFFIAELVLTIPVLALFGIADPDLYRTRLWQDGYDNGFNSNPREILYAYANHRPIPTTPLVWSQFLTSYNVVISVLSTFILLVKAIMFILHLWVPLLSFLVHGALAGLWLFSAYGQAAPDMSDPKQPQPGAPWYIAKNCSVARSGSNVGYCRQAKASFAVTVVLAILFTVNTAWAIWSMVPTEQEKRARQEERDEDADDKNWLSPKSSFELKELPKNYEARCGALADGFPPPPTPARGKWTTMKAAMTPRTLAFNQLEGRLD